MTIFLHQETVDREGKENKKETKTLFMKSSRRTDDEFFRFIVWGEWSAVYLPPSKKKKIVDTDKSLY